MTIHNYNPNHFSDFPKFSFGLPLEDVSIPGVIHPVIEVLLQTTRVALLKCDYTLEVILRDLQGTVNHRLALKNRLLNWRPNTTLQGHPGAFIWLIRHFLGLLPLPIFPLYACHLKFEWLKLSELCKDYFVNSRYAYDKNENFLVNKIGRKLSKLPEANMTMIMRVIKFMRKVVMSPYYEDHRIKKSALLVLVKYFTSSMFSRPFRPGIISQEEKRYQPLLMYLMIKWPKIEHIYYKYNKLEANTEDSLTKCSDIKNTYPAPRHSCEPTDLDDSESQLSVINEADSQLQLTIDDDQDKPISLVRLVPYIYYYNTNQYLKDISCQTDIIEENSFFISADDCVSNKCDEEEIMSDQKGTYINFDITKNDYNKYFKNKNKTSSVSLDDNFKFKDKSKENTEKKCFTTFHQPGFKKNCTDNKEGIYGWVYSNTSELSDSSEQDTKAEADGYIFDEYSSFQIDETKSSQNLLKTKGSCIQPDGEDNDIMQRISKIGWSYSQKSPTNKHETNELIAKNSKDQYHIYYEEKQNDENMCGVPCTTEIDIQSPVSSTSKSKLKLAKIASKLDIRRYLGNRRSGVKNICSADQIPSHVKYKKIESTKSSFF